MEIRLEITKGENMTAKFAFLLVLLMGLEWAFAQSGSDANAVKFSAQLMSTTPFKAVFRAPPGHHFNQEAPTKVEMQNNGANQPGAIAKTLQAINVDFGKDVKPASGCNLKARLFVCNDANTYCLPITQEYECQKLQAVKN